MPHSKTLRTASHSSRSSVSRKAESGEPLAAGGGLGAFPPWRFPSLVGLEIQCQSEAVPKRQAPERALEVIHLTLLLCRVLRKSSSPLRGASHEAILVRRRGASACLFREPSVALIQSQVEQEDVEAWLAQDPPGAGLGPLPNQGLDLAHGSASRGRNPRGLPESGRRAQVWVEAACRRGDELLRGRAWSLRVLSL